MKKKKKKNFLVFNKTIAVKTKIISFNHLNNCRY